MSTCLIGTSIPLEVKYPDGTYILLEVNSNSVFENGIRTDKIDGYKYLAVDTLFFDRINVKILGQKEPLISNEQLQEMRKTGQKVIVEFIDGVIKPYWSRDTRSIEDSFSANDIRLVETN